MGIAEQGVPLGSGSAFGHPGPSPEKAGMNRWSPSDAYNQYNFKEHMIGELHQV
jgi:hypothetical protein